MLIGTMSDSHDNIQGVKDALKIFSDRGVKLVLHAGDMIGSGNCYTFEGCNMDVKLVYGNNDGDRVGLMRDFKRVGENTWETLEKLMQTAERLPCSTARMGYW